MKKRIINFLRSVFISFETLSWLFLIALFQYAPNIYYKVGQWYLNEANWVIGVGINGGFLAFCLVQSKQVLFPINNSMNRLKGWPNYILLKDTTLAGLFFCAIPVLLAFVSYIFKNEIDTRYLGLSFIVNLVIPIVAITSLYKAEIDIRILLEQEENNIEE